MGTELKLKKIHTVQQRIKFLASLTYNAKFYRIISEVVSDPGKLDKTLGTLCYSALFLSTLIKRFPEIKRLAFRTYGNLVTIWNKVIVHLFSRYHREDLCEKLIFKPINLDTEVDKERKTSQFKISQTLKSFSGYVSDIRIFNRGFSIPACIADILESGALLKDKRYLEWFSTICISLYQPFETIAFLFDHNWLLPDRKSNNCLWWYAVSTRFWFVWVISEFTKLGYKIVKSHGRGISSSELIVFIEHLATLPLCVHWSLEEGCLDPIYVGFLGTIAGGVSTMKMWKDVWIKILKEI